MKFIWRSILAGLFVVVLPVTLILILLKRTFESVHAAVEPFAAKLPFEAQFPGLWAVLILLVLSFTAGLILQIRPVRNLAISGSDRLAKRFPFYRFLRGFGQSFMEKGADRPVKAALAEIEEALVPAYVVEELADGRCVVFVPAVPSPIQGAVYILAPERVHLLDAGIGRIASCVSHWGVGSGELVKAMRNSEKRR